MIIQASPASSFFLAAIKHTFSEASSEIGEYIFVGRIIGRKPTDDGTDARISLLFPVVVAVVDCAFRGSDICCYLLDGGTFNEPIGIIAEKECVGGAAFILEGI